jgi:CheY-like chemotaxis protein
MDCQMPVMDGYTATREIRKLAQFKDLPIIAMTANAMAGDKEKVIAAGMWDHIAKPLNVGAMFATMAQWFRPESLTASTPMPMAVGDIDVANNAYTESDGGISNQEIKSSTAQSSPTAALQANPAVQAAVEHLERLLRDSDSDAEDALEALLALTQGSALASQLKRVEQSLDVFDFDTALARLHQALTDIGR